MRNRLPLLWIAFAVLLIASGVTASPAHPEVIQPSMLNLQACPAFPLDGAQAATGSAGTGTGLVTLNPRTRVLAWEIVYSGLSSPTTGAHFHGPALPGQDGPIVIGSSSLNSPITGSQVLTDRQMLQLINGEWYFNIHSTEKPNGEIRGQVTVCADPAGPALPLTFPLDGAQANQNSPGTGSGIVLIDANQKTITYNIHYGGLLGPVTGAHFHGPAAPGMSAPIVVNFISPASPIEGSAQLTDAFLLQVLNGEWYANVHTNVFPAGEIRGQVIPNLAAGSDPCLAAPFPIDGPQSGTSSTATGTGLAIFDVQTRQFTYNLAFQGLSSAPTVAHFHGPAQPGVGALPVITITDLTSPSEGATVLTAPQAQQAMSGLWYANYHTSAYTGGEIRGQVKLCLTNLYKTWLPALSR